MFAGAGPLGARTSFFQSTSRGGDGTSQKLASHPGIKHLGPGLITGAADDDPSGIATYSQGGAQFGFNMLWTVILTYPLMSGIQMISARLGCLTGRGLAANIKAQFPRPVLFAVVGLLLVANTVNIAADIAAMGEALRLLLGGSAHVYSVTFGLLCLCCRCFCRTSAMSATSNG